MMHDDLAAAGLHNEQERHSPVRVNSTSTRLNRRFFFRSGGSRH